MRGSTCVTLISFCHKKEYNSCREGVTDWVKSGMDFRVDVEKCGGDQVCRSECKSVQQAEELTILLEVGCER